MLTKIELTDFQCHEHLSLDLGKITTLVGPSDSGKSTIIRALDWAVYNNGRTAQLIRRGAKAASVTITVDDHIVTRTTKKNAYIVDGTELSSIGRSQPVDVPNIFRMGEDNIQRQHEYLFWFSASGSELTRNFNRVVDLSKLDEWVHIGIETEKKYKQDVQYCRQRLDELTEDESKLLPYEVLETELGSLRDSYTSLLSQNDFLTVVGQICSDDHDAYVRCRVLEACRIQLELFLGRHDEIVSEKNLVALYVSLQQITGSLSRYQDFAASLQELLAECKDILAVSHDISFLVGCGVELRDGGSRLEALRVAASIEIPFRVLFSLREELSELADISDVLSRSIPDTLPVHSALEEYRDMSDQFAVISDILSDLGSCEAGVVSAKHELEKTRSVFEDISGGVCPLCGQLMGGHNHE